MNYGETRERLVRTAIELFAQRGYDGTSIRAITQAAGANLGAVTYHFGSKAALFDACLALVVAPFRDRIAAHARAPGAPLDRIDGILRTFFDYLSEQPALPALLLQVLVTPRHMPAAAREGFAANHAAIADLIAAGQRAGSIRAGDPRLMALSVATQPVMLTLVRRVLSQAIGVDQDDASVRAQVVDSVATFVRAGLRSGVDTP
ncbi:MAG TPA: TetR/AcrR family transcriptional regulator [Gemmatimonadales bacterium]|jgi:AcrR family transcriptional regulator